MENNTNNKHVSHINGATPSRMVLSFHQQLKKLKELRLNKRSKIQCAAFPDGLNQCTNFSAFIAENIDKLLAKESTWTLSNETTIIGIMLCSRCHYKIIYAHLLRCDLNNLLSQTSLNWYEPLKRTFSEVKDDSINKDQWKISEKREKAGTQAVDSFVKSSVTNQPLPNVQINSPNEVVLASKHSDDDETLGSRNARGLTVLTSERRGKSVEPDSFKNRMLHETTQGIEPKIQQPTASFATFETSRFKDTLLTFTAPPEVTAVEFQSKETKVFENLAAAVEKVSIWNSSKPNSIYSTDYTLSSPPRSTRLRNRSRRNSPLGHHSSPTLKRIHSANEVDVIPPDYQISGSNEMESPPSISNPQAKEYTGRGLEVEYADTAFSTPNEKRNETPLSKYSLDPLVPCSSVDSRPSGPMKSASDPGVQGKEVEDLTIDTSIREQIMVNLIPHKVYVYSLNSSSMMTKVGITAQPSISRKKQVSRCWEEDLRLYRSRDVMFNKKVETFVHRELSHFNIKKKCAVCGKEHQEWFEVEPEIAWQAVQRWSIVVENAYLEREGSIKELWSKKLKETLKLPSFMEMETAQSDPKEHHRIRHERYQNWINEMIRLQQEV